MGCSDSTPLIKLVRKLFASNEKIKTSVCIQFVMDGSQSSQLGLGKANNLDCRGETPSFPSNNVSC